MDLSVNKLRIKKPRKKDKENKATSVYNLVIYFGKTMNP